MNGNRIMDDEQNRIFTAFNDELQRLGDELDPLKGINSKSAHTLQIISFHLTYEFYLDCWLNFKLNGGKSLFSGISSIGFFNKMYLAKNAGMPKPIFHALDLINKERNDLAHKVEKREVSAEKIDDFVEKIDAISPGGIKVEMLTISEVGRDVTIKCEDSGGRLLIALHGLLGQLRSFIYIDIYEQYSFPYEPGMKHV